ncbi:replication factor C small subunit [Candidatus Woesearchaeota archaeon]|nr:replication factor C small subunit [Candidatus Woesearchaeota archaeon]
MEVWTEKYRPKKLEGIRGQDDITSRLKAFMKSRSFPHLLFAGPAGTGKTTAALAISREIYGEDWSDNILELNASDERGINVVRNKIKDFARTKALEDVPFKVIYLDESDALTKEAQHALRRIMEDYTHTVRFILSCNYSSKIISPIQSRCAVFRFKPLPKESVVEILNKIIKNEDLVAEQEALELIYEVSEGDMRKAENLLQACASVTKNVNIKAVTEVVGFAEPQEIEKIIKLSIAGRFTDAKKKLTEVMVGYGLSGLDVVKQIQKQIWKLNIDDSIKIKLIRACGEYEFRLVEGSNEFIQLAAMLAEFSLIAKK